MFNRKANRIAELEEWIDAYKAQQEIALTALRKENKDYRECTRGLDFYTVARIIEYFKTMDRSILKVRGFTEEELDEVFKDR